MAEKGCCQQTIMHILKNVRARTRQFLLWQERKRTQCKVRPNSSVACSTLQLYLHNSQSTRIKETLPERRGWTPTLVSGQLQIRHFIIKLCRDVVFETRKITDLYPRAEVKKIPKQGSYLILELMKNSCNEQTYSTVMI